MKTERLRHVGENPMPLTIFKKKVKARKKSRSAMFGVVSCLKDKFLEDTIQEIGIGNDVGNGGVCLRTSANNEAKVANT